MKLNDDIYIKKAEVVYRMTTVKLILSALFPVALAIITYWLDKKTKFGKLPFAAKQIIIGIIFRMSCNRIRYSDTRGCSECPRCFPSHRRSSFRRSCRYHSRFNRRYLPLVQRILGHWSVYQACLFPWHNSCGFHRCSLQEVYV